MGTIKESQRRESRTDRGPVERPRDSERY